MFPMMHNFICIVLLFGCSNSVVESAPFLTSLVSAASTCVDEMTVNSDGKSIGTNLEKRVIRLFDEAASLPLSLSREDGNIEVRTKFEGQLYMSFAEAKVVKNQPPNVFRGFLQNFNKHFSDATPMIKEVRHLEHDGNIREGIKAFMGFPPPISDRVMVHWKYLRLDRKKDEHLIILSEEGNEKLLENHLSKEERKKYVLARTFLCAFWIKPAWNSNKNEIIGSNIKYVYSGDVGGSIPQQIQRWIGPRTALDSVKSVIVFGKKTATKE
mmetsp:Transcript_11409/g.13084  ORF Transcript_11409/g.13084 Transcript_11409/m.13084 type:complete len:269 (+) Transcript_11409:131-937(+)